MLYYIGLYKFDLFLQAGLPCMELTRKWVTFSSHPMDTPQIISPGTRYCKEEMNLSHWFLFIRFQTCFTLNHLLDLTIQLDFHTAPRYDSIKKDGNKVVLFFVGMSGWQDLRSMQVEWYKSSWSVSVRYLPSQLMQIMIGCSRYGHTLLAFFEKFPEYKSNDLFMTGEVI